jgi:hypothetical protein
MNILLFLGSAALAGVAVMLLTWHKAGMGRTLLAAAIGMAAGLGAILAVQLLQNQDVPLSAGELLGPFIGAFIAATAANRRAAKTEA